MKKATSKILNDLCSLIYELDDSDYGNPLVMLSGFSIGKHVRHIIEFYKCLLDSLNSDKLCYDDRERSQIRERNKGKAIESIEAIAKQICSTKYDFSLQLKGNFSLNSEPSNLIKTSFYREVAYNLEHSIHHMAIIKVAIKGLKLGNLIDDNFGVAISTIRYNKQSEIHV
jgi:hypothetical protein